MTHSTSSSNIFCDIFCVVIDNYGDAGICWRLASQLANEHRWQVRLLLEDKELLRQLAPDFEQSPIKVCRWNDASEGSADIVIEAFGCELPEDYVTKMSHRAKPPVWLNLEYLSAEPWVSGCHAMPSPHPRLRLSKYFFFPGFVAATGGLLRESDYDTRRQAFDPNAFRAEFGLPQRLPNELCISLFSYSNPALSDLLKSLSASDRPIRVLMPGNGIAPVSKNNLSCHPLPFLSQRRYDELLWACDLNFVRGEDSFVRAHWAAKPFVWNIYPQADKTHLAKLDAFLNLAFAPQKVGVDATAARFWRAWNGEGLLDWPAFSADLPQFEEATRGWVKKLLEMPDLATKLVQFCRQRLE